MQPEALRDASRARAREQPQWRGSFPFCGCSEFVLGSGILTFPDRLDVVGERLPVRTGALHEVAYEARLSSGCDVENVIQDQDLAVGVRPCADAYYRHMQRLRDLFAQRRRN